MSFRARRAGLVAAALLLVGCLSPTLPLPPPSEPAVTSTDTQGLVRLTGMVDPDSEVFALNRNTNLIGGQYTSSGSYDFTLEARDHDSISFWYVRGTTESLPNEFVLELAPQGTP